MGRRSRAMARRRSRMAASASASASGDSGLSKKSALPAVSPCGLSCGAVSVVSPASDGLAGCKGIQAASASEDLKHESSSEEGMGIQAASASEDLKHESSEEGKILKLDSLNLGSERILQKLEPWSEEVSQILMYDSEEEGEGEIVEECETKILSLDSEEDREILMKVKSEEGKILKLKKEFMAASEAALLGLSSYIGPVPTVKPAAKMKTKKTLVVKTLVPPEYIALIKVMPCPPEMNISEEDLAYEPQSIQDYHRQRTSLNMKMRDYHQALVDQYDRFGFAVDETEFTVNEDEENAVKN